jgi:hypothetical protein
MPDRFRLRTLVCTTASAAGAGNSAPPDRFLSWGHTVADFWYYSHDHAKIGPCSGRRMKELAAAGGILPTDVVWKQGVEKGVAASKVKYLFAPPPAVAPSAAIVEVPEVLPPTEAPVPAPPPVAVELKPEPVAEQIPEPAAPPASGWHGETRKGRATAGRGAVLVGQDGVTVKFRKKCTTCGHLDSSWNTIPIRNGVMRAGFYCTKCRKHRDVEVHGSLH